MRILFFSRSLCGGGAERVLSNLSSELASKGHDIFIAINEYEESYPIDERVHMIIAPQLDSYKGNNPLRRIYRRVIRSHRNSIHTCDTINSVHPDVIVTFLQCNLLPIIRHHGNTPIVHSEHNAYDRCLGWSYYFNRFYLNRFFDRVCVLSHFDQGYAKAKKLRNVVFMPNPNTFDSIDEKTYDSLFANRKNILLCGRVNAWKVKGFDIAIKVFSRLFNKFPDLYLDIAGDGDERAFNQLRKIAEECEIQHRVRFLGRCKNIQDVYQQYQILLLSSRTEGFPMVISEAMSQGLPCVSFERLASSIIIDGQDGILVNDGDLISLCEAMNHLLEDTNLRYEMGLNATKNIGRFSRGKVGERWETMLNKLIDKQEYVSHNTYTYHEQD